MANIRDEIIANLVAGPRLAGDIMTEVSGSSNWLPRYKVAVEMLPMIREGIIVTDADVPPELDRVVTGPETLRLPVRIEEVDEETK